MKLLELEVRNWCQHVHHQCTFGDSLTAILGANGSGKSTLFGAIKWLLTGDNPNTGKMEENIFQLAPADERSNGRLAFEHRGQRLEVIRHLRPASERATLEINGEQVALGVTNVNARIFSTLGVDAALLNRFALVSQGDIFGFLAETEAVRSQAFQKLFDTSKAAVIHKILTDKLAKLQIPQVDALLDQVRAAIVTTAARRTQVGAALTALPPLIDIEEQITNANRTVQQHLMKQSLQNQITTCETNLNTVHTQILTRETELKQRTDDLAVLRQAADGGREACEQAKATLANWSHFKQQQVAEQRLKDRWAQFLLVKLTAPTPPAEPAEYANREAISTEYGTLSDQINRDKSLITTFRTQGLAACPTCGTPTDQLEAHVQACEQRMPASLQRQAELRSRLEDFRAYATDHQAYTTALRVYETAYANHHASLQQLKQDEQAFKAVAPPTATEEEIKAVVASHEEYVAAIAELEPALNALQQAQARAEGSHAIIQEQIDGLKGQLQANPVTADESRFAAERLPELRTQLLQRTQLEADWQEVSGQDATLHQQLRNLQAEQARAAKLQAWVARAEEWRSLFHHSAAPRFVAQRNLQRLQATVNELLATFDTPFRVTADEGLSFTAHFVDGRVQPARRLSGGQKVVLALAFRVAVNWMFAQSIGLLALDEPTAYLDKKHIRAFAPVLERLRALAESRGLQCLLITHEEELAPLFEAVIRIA